MMCHIVFLNKKEVRTRQYFFNKKKHAHAKRDCVHWHVALPYRAASQNVSVCCRTVFPRIEFNCNRFQFWMKEKKTICKTMLKQ